MYRNKFPRPTSVNQGKHGLKANFTIYVSWSTFSAIVSVQSLVLLVLFFIFFFLYHALAPGGHGGAVLCDLMASVAAILFHNRLLGMENQNDNDPNDNA